MASLALACWVCRAVAPQFQRSMEMFTLTSQVE